MLRNGAPSRGLTGRRGRRLAVVAAVAIAVTTGIAGCSTSSDGGGSDPSASASSGTCASTTTLSSNASLAAAQKTVNRAELPVTKWDGPTSGPKAATGKSVVFIVSAASNTGDTGVYAGFAEAAKAIGWSVKLIDGQSTASGNLAALNQAIALKPDAIAVSSFDPTSSASAFATAKADGILVVGNHTGEGPGPSSQYPDLFTNVTSDPTAIADVAADCAIVAGNGKASVTITGCGKEFIICQAKQDAMAAAIGKSSGSKVLKNNSFPFEDINQQEPGLATADYQRFGKDLNFMLSINDNYWDAAIPALQAVGATPSGPPLMIAAGDGSPAAFSRIRGGQFQIATVAEPLNEHGWQLIDEINRGLQGAQPSGFVTYPRLVTKANVDLEGGKKGTFDPSNNYRAEYKKIWGVG